MSLLVIFDNFSMNYTDRSYLKLVVDPFSLLVSAVGALESACAFSLAFPEVAVEAVTIYVAIDAFAMQVVVAESSLIDVFVRKFEDADTVLHATAPISFVLRSRKEIVSTVTIDLIINETARVLFPWLVIVIPPSALHALLHLALINIAVLVFDAESAVS